MHAEDNATNGKQPTPITNLCQEESFADFVAKQNSRTDEPTKRKRVKYEIQAKRIVNKNEYKATSSFYIGRDINAAGLSPGAFRVLGYIKSRAGDYGRRYYCSIRDMCRICKMTQRAVEKAIIELEQQHFVTCRKQNRKTTEFTVLGPEHWMNWIMERG